MNLNWFGGLENLLGFLSLIFYLLSLLPGIARSVLPKFAKQKWLLNLRKYRRQIGVVAWVFGFAHGTYILIDRELNLLDLNVAKNYFQGIILITIFSLLAITSNNYSVKKLKKNWHKLHQLTYLALFVLIWHVLDKMMPGWTVWTYIEVILLFIFGLFLIVRLVKNYRKK